MFAVATLAASLAVMFLDEEGRERAGSPAPTTGVPAPTTGGSTPALPIPAEPDVQYRGKVLLTSGRVLVFGRDRAVTRPEPTSGFEVWWDVQLSPDGETLQVLGRNLLVESGPRPDWRTCRVARGGREVLKVSARRSLFCMDLRFAGTASVVATPGEDGGVTLDYLVWAR